MATLKAMYPKDRLEKAETNFSSADDAANIAMLYCETEDRSQAWCVLLSDTAVTPAHFVAFDDGEDLPVGTLLIDQAVGTATCAWMLTAEDTYTQVGELT